MLVGRASETGAVSTAFDRTLAGRLARFVLDSDVAALGPELLAWGGERVLDTAAAAAAGLQAPSSRAVFAAMLDDQPQATVLGRGRAASALAAALVNGTVAHAAELDDDHRTATLHPGAVVVPAALAACELADASGATFLRAVVLGYEAMCRVGEAFVGRQFYRGFHPTGTCGVFGAAIAAAVAFELGHSELVNALGIAGTQACGLGEWSADGTWTKRLHPGLAAQSGVRAALLAQEGFTGPATILEGRHGFLRAFANDGGFDQQAITRGLGETYTSLQTAYKPYPCCRFAHGAIDLAIEAHQSGLDAAAIARVDVTLFRTDVLTPQTCPATPVDAQFAVPYLVAVALCHGDVRLADFSEAAIRDPEALRVAAAVAMAESDAFTGRYPQRYPTRLSITSKHDATWSGYSDCPRGDPAAPVYDDDPRSLERDLRRKVRTVLTEAGLGSNIEALTNAIDALPAAPDLQDLTRALGVAPGGPQSPIQEKEPQCP